MLLKKYSPGWMGGWMDGWMDVKAVLRIAYSNKKYLHIKQSKLKINKKIKHLKT